MPKEKRNKTEGISAKELIDRLFSPETSAEEVEEIRIWLAAIDNKAIYSDELRAKFKESLHFEEDSDYAREMWLQLAARLGLDTVYTKSRTMKVTRRADRGKYIALRVAAALIPIFVVVTAWSLLFNKADGTAGGRMAEIVTVSASAGEKQTIILPDDSRVTLEAGATLEYDTKNFMSERKARISGEAVFNVAALADVNGERVPFTVSAGAFSISVLGTVFRVRGQNASFETSVALYQGAVVVTTEAATAELGHGEQFTLDTQTGDYDINMIPATEMTVNGFKPVMKFRDSSLGNLITALEANYDVTFTTGPKVDPSEGRYTTDLEGLTLGESLDILKKVDVGLTFTQKGSNITITKTKI